MAWQFFVTYRLWNRKRWTPQTIYRDGRLQIKVLCDWFHTTNLSTLRIYLWKVWLQVNDQSSSYIGRLSDCKNSDLGGGHSEKARPGHWTLRIKRSLPSMVACEEIETLKQVFILAFFMWSSQASWRTGKIHGHNWARHVFVLCARVFFALLNVELQYVQIPFCVVL